MTRCFVAVELPAPVRSALVEVQQSLRAAGPGLRFVGAEQLHVTLRFLGDCRPDQVAALRAAVAALAVPATKLRLEGIGVFPPHGLPRVVWAGLAGDVASFVRLAAELERTAVAAGLPPETRPPHLHATLARIGPRARPGQLRVLLRDGKVAVPALEFTPPAVTLFASELSAAGSHYTALERRLVATTSAAPSADRGPDRSPP